MYYITDTNTRSKGKTMCSESLFSYFMVCETYNHINTIKISTVINNMGWGRYFFERFYNGHLPSHELTEDVRRETIRACGFSPL